MSASLLLTMIAIASLLVVFADKVTQWSLRHLLNGNLDNPRARAEMAEAAAAEQASHAVKAA